MEALHDVVKAGKARYLGASSMWAWQFAKMQHVASQHGWTRFVSMQDQYSLVQALQAESGALEAGIDPEQVRAAHATAYVGASAYEGVGPLMLLQARAMSPVAMILRLEPDPRALVADAVLAASVKAAAALAGLLHFRHTAATGGDEAATEEINALFEMAVRLRRARSGLDPHRLTGAEGALDADTGQVREEDSQKLRNVNPT